MSAMVYATYCLQRLRSCCLRRVADPTPLHPAPSRWGLHFVSFSPFHSRRLPRTMPAHAKSTSQPILQPTPNINPKPQLFSSPNPNPSPNLDPKLQRTVGGSLRSASPLPLYHSTPHLRLQASEQLLRPPPHILYLVYRLGWRRLATTL